MNSETATTYVGIDIGAYFHHVAILSTATIRAEAKPKALAYKLHNRRQDYDRLLADLAAAGGPSAIAIAIDHTGGNYSAPLVATLTAEGYQPIFLPTHLVKEAREKLLGQVDKSDRRDAIALAIILHAHHTLPSVVRLNAIQPRLGTTASALGSLARQRWAQNKLATQATNRLHQLLSATWPEVVPHLTLVAPYLPEKPGPRFYATPPLGKGRAFRALGVLHELAQDSVGITDPTYEAAIARIATDRLEAIAKRDAIEDQLARLIAEHPYGPIIGSFPGVGAIAAATLIAAIVDVSRFNNRWAFRKALGVAAINTSSGQLAPRGRMSKAGNADTRRVLFQICLSAASPRSRPTPWGDYHRKHKALGKPGMKAIAAAMGKLAEVLYACLTKGEPYHYEPPQPAPEHRTDQAQPTPEHREETTAP